MQAIASGVTLDPLCCNDIDSGKLLILLQTAQLVVMFAVQPESIRKWKRFQKKKFTGNAEEKLRFFVSSSLHS